MCLSRSVAVGIFRSTPWSAQLHVPLTEAANDIAFPGMLFGRTIRSTIPRGLVRSIKLDFDTTGFTIVDYRDVPAKNAVDLMSHDQPFLAEHEVRHMAEPIVLLAHEDKETLHAAKV